MLLTCPRPDWVQGLGRDTLALPTQESWERDRIRTLRRFGYKHQRDLDIHSYVSLSILIYL